MAKLTTAQGRVLALVQKHEGERGLKNMILGHEWRVLDRLEALGLVERCTLGSWLLNDAGRAALGRL